MYRRVASTLILINWLRMFYLEEGRGEGIPRMSGVLVACSIASCEDDIGIE
jgi:hypothetical protein